MSIVFLEVTFFCAKFAVCSPFEVSKHMKVVPESRDRLSVALVQVLTWPPSDFHLFQALKEFLGGRRFTGDEERKNDVKV